MKKETKPTQQVSPSMLIIGVCGLGAAVWLLLPQSPTQTGTPVNNLTRTTPAVATSSPAPSQQPVESVARDPFLPPSVIGSMDDRSEHTPLTPVIEQPKVATPSPKVDSANTNSANTKQEIEEPKEILPVWKGIISTAEKKTVLIGYKNKTYLLKLGNLLPETGYRLVDIGPDWILLKSESKQLRLAKTKGAR